MTYVVFGLFSVEEGRIVSEAGENAEKSSVSH